MRLGDYDPSEFERFGDIVWIEGHPELSSVTLIDKNKRRRTFRNLESVDVSNTTAVGFADDGSFSVAFERPTRCLLYKKAALSCGEKVLEQPDLFEREERRLGLGINESRP